VPTAVGGVGGYPGAALGGTNAVVDEAGGLPTSRLFREAACQATGQEKANGLGLYYYNARWYDSELGRFVQPDTIVPDAYDPLSLDRYAYARNNPVKYTDPSGRTTECGPYGGTYCSQTYSEYRTAEDWKKAGLTFDQFLASKEAYVFYMSHPQTALEDSLADTDSYAAADFYSEYVLHQLLQPFGDDLVLSNIEKARLVGDEAMYYALMSGLVFTAWIQDASGQRISIDISDGVYVDPQNALEIADQFLGEGNYMVEPGRYMSRDGLRQVRMQEEDLRGIHANGSHMNFEFLEQKPGQPGRFIRVENWHIYFK
jgi:RHS repeat-associated protein